MEVFVKFCKFLIKVIIFDGANGIRVDSVNVSHELIGDIP
jgi:hypothetical protein